MYAYLDGVVKEINPRYIVLENNGIGYLLLTPNSYNYQIEEKRRFYVYHYVREDMISLYAFDNNEFRNLFIRLLGVSGIGPKSALSILAVSDINDVIVAIENSDVKYLVKFPGIGMKSAQQIILDLKGKLVEVTEKTTPKNSEVEEALLALGYSKTDIKKVIQKVDNNQETEKILKDALKLFLK